MNKLSAILGAATMLVVGSSGWGAQAALPVGTLSFAQPDGVAGRNDSIDIVLRLTLDANSDPFIVDSNGFVTSGGPSDDELLAVGFSIDEPYFVSTSLGGAASGSFFASDYVITFANNLTDFSVLPGQSRDFVFGSFVPINGPTPPGVYNFYEAFFYVVAYRFLDGGGYEDKFFTIGQTCATGDNGCDFSRTVRAAVPEPTTWAMMILGFGAAGAALRARRRRATVAL